MAQGVYTFSKEFSNDAAKTLMYITAPSGKPVRVLSARVTISTEESADQIYIAIQKISSLGTPTSTGDADVFKHTSNSGNAASTVKYNITGSEPTYSAGTLGGRGVLHSTGWEWVPGTEKEEVWLNGSESLGIRCIDAPAAASDFAVELTVEEV